MGIFRNSAVYAASIALIVSGFSFSAKAQTYRDKIEENPERAGGVYHYYEYAPSALTKAPKGYKPFYISHYGRHGSRYHTSANLFKGAVETFLRREGGIAYRRGQAAEDADRLNQHGASRDVRDVDRERRRRASWNRGKDVS